jgi:hypothetical protein
MRDTVEWVSGDYSICEAPFHSFAVDGQMLVTLVEQRILASCVDDAELFYFPFAMVNYGGQVFRRDDGPDRGRYEDEEEWSVALDGATIADALSRLVRQGLMRCWRLQEEGHEREELLAPTDEEFALYEDYDCVTFSDHTERFGYGPHSFIATEVGLKTLGLPARR